jgi:hypothetical protein
VEACFMGDMIEEINDIIYSGPVLVIFCDELESEQVTLPFKYCTFKGTRDSSIRNMITLW